MPFVKDRMIKDLESKPRVDDGELQNDQALEENAFERLGKDVVIIEILSIMNIVFALFTFTLLGLLIYEKRVNND